MFIIIDGLDGCGKGKIIEILASGLEKWGKKIFDLRIYGQNKHKLPEYKEIKDFDVVLSCEPTWAWIGETIRNELIQKNDRKYSTLSIAHAFALDREILYRRILLKARRDKKIILQERGFSSSIVYQKLQEKGPSIDSLLGLPGNELAKQNPPNILVIPRLCAETAVQRLSERKKKDKSIFEKLEFLRKVAGVYYSDWFRSFFETLGTQVIYIDTGGSLEETEKQAKKFLQNYLSS